MASFVTNQQPQPTTTLPNIDSQYTAYQSAMTSRSQEAAALLGTYKSTITSHSQDANSRLTSYRNEVDSLTRDLNSKKTEFQNSSSCFSVIAFASAIIDPLVDSFVTPESLVMMMEGKKPKINESNKKTATSSSEKKSNISMGYDGIDYFVLDAKDEKNEIQFSFVFKRKGIWDWELTSVRNLKT